MRKSFKRALALFSAASVMASAFAANVAAAPLAPVTEIEELKPLGEALESFPWQLVALTNKQRILNGLEPLSMNDEIFMAADTRAEELPSLFDHLRPDGSDINTVLPAGSWWTIGENIAAGQWSEQEALNAWMNSSGHRANILNSNFDHIGASMAFGGSTPYWVQLFIGCPNPPAAYAVTTDLDEGAGFARVGTEIEDMSLILATYCDTHGDCFIPITNEMVTGFNPQRLGQQEITINYKNQKLKLDVGIHPFKDLGNTWYTEAAFAMYVSGVMTGKTPTTFEPVSKLSRAQLATILYRISGGDDMEKIPYNAPFPDVKQDTWYGEAVNWAYNAGVINGYDNGTFGPANNITREQLAVMLYRFADKAGFNISKKASLSSFTDGSKVSAFAKEAMAWAVGTGIITGKANGTKLDPIGSCTRAEAAVMLVRFIREYGE